ncbi:MAG: hypothetical protein HUU22_07980 [Phycisphaerae bacterium]|nr:hypothetical protein [Phycisphaerae bacterium]NUQ45956.1 hypothetical protein [Phycisphaerae bacterium]
MIDPFNRPASQPIRFARGDTVILCEGLDECAVLRKLAGNGAHELKIGTRSSEEGLNWEGEFSALANQVRLHAIASVGFVFDAEGDREKRKKELHQWLQTAGFKPPPKALTLAESSLDGVRVKTAYLINPHAHKSGAIESLFLPQIRRSKRWKCIQQLLECYQREAPTRQLVDKLIVRTFIAHGNAANTGLNAAFRAGILNCDGPEFDPLRRLLDLLRSVTSQQSGGKP